MSVSVEPFVGEIGLVGFNFPPRGWAICNGQLLSISSNTALFSLLGTTYGGDGRVTFGLPNLQGSTPIGFGQGPGLSNRVLGEIAGTTSVTILQNEMPAHTHALGAGLKTGAPPTTANAVASLPATATGTDLLYADTASSTAYMAPLAVNLDTQTSILGGNQPHNNMQPYLTVLIVIAFQGIFPQRQ
ncbi:Tail collar protein [Pedobacter cryoconitis]|uniref:Tail collar protein n=1 Tax=Pedobacter cryoconitis TaxID=188932 RepID=A0A127VEF4_9SPHI|nr:tail fiber protein [Pedobacter cryoconitis]AMP99580.1 Tail collar protein [Pedobacter cryoconitis]